jgi:VanZ family protein
MSERPLAVVPPWRWWAGLFLVLAVAGYLSGVAYREGLPVAFQLFPEFDKMVHFLAAGLLTFFLDGALKRRAAFTVAGVAVPLAAALVLVPAAAEEFMQRYSVYRTSSIWDFVADLAGVALMIPLSRRAAQ